MHHKGFNASISHDIMQKFFHGGPGSLFKTPKPFFNHYYLPTNVYSMLAANTLLYQPGYLHKRFSRKHPEEEKTCQILLAQLSF